MIEIAGLKGFDLRKAVALALGWRGDFHQSNLSGLWYATSPEGEAETPLPEYDTDADAALSLVLGADEFALWMGLARWCATFDPECHIEGAEPMRGKYAVSEDMDDPAVAVCRAWLMMQPRCPACGSFHVADYSSQGMAAPNEFRRTCLDCDYNFY